jgi:hypothetical protein
LACDISWGEVTLISQFQFGLQSDVDLLLTLLDPSTLSQAITQFVWFDNRLFEHRQERCHEPTSTTQKSFAPSAIQSNTKEFCTTSNIKKFPPTMIAQPLATLPKDNPMQIDKTKIKPFTEQKKQCQHTNNLRLYYGEPSHVACECPKKCGPHATRTIFITNPQPGKSKNEHV